MRTIVAMRVISIIKQDGFKVWHVLDNNNEPIASISQYLTYLHNLQRSPNTIRAYAYHLKHFWEYLSQSKLVWTAVKLDNLASFITWLRSASTKVIVIHQTVSRRTESSINAALAAVTAFYKFHEQIGNIENLDLYSSQIAISSKYKPFLNHLNKTGLTKTRTLKIKVPLKLPRTFDRQMVEQLLSACYYVRDKFLICMLYETGMRIGELLGIQHQDIHSWDNEIHLVPRTNNPNEARSKSHRLNIIPVSASLMKLYTHYLLAELEDVESNYVFVGLKGQKRGQPLRYTAVQDLFLRLSKAIGSKVTPHMMRHTHATDLIQQGWDMALVQKRLGHLSIQTTINIYTHLSSQDIKNALKNYKIRSIADELVRNRSGKTD
jgi:integrase/recombinase XerD